MTTHNDASGNAPFIHLYDETNLDEMQVFHAPPRADEPAHDDWPCRKPVATTTDHDVLARHASNAHALSYRTLYTVLPAPPRRGAASRTAVSHGEKLFGGTAVRQFGQFQCHQRRPVPGDIDMVALESVLDETERVLRDGRDCDTNLCKSKKARCQPTRIKCDRDAGRDSNTDGNDCRTPRCDTCRAGHVHTNSQHVHACVRAALPASPPMMTHHRPPSPFAMRTDTKKEEEALDTMPWYATYYTCMQHYRNQYCDMLRQRRGEKGATELSTDDLHQRGGTTAMPSLALPQCQQARPRRRAAVSAQEPSRPRHVRSVPSFQPMPCAPRRHSVYERKRRELSLLGPRWAN